MTMLVHMYVMNISVGEYVCDEHECYCIYIGVYSDIVIIVLHMPGSSYGCPCMYSKTTLLQLVTRCFLYRHIMTLSAE